MAEPENLIIRTWTQDAWTFVRERSVTIDMTAGEKLCRDGDPFTHFIFPQTGILSVLSAVAGERAVEVLSVGREGFFGLPLLSYGLNCEGDVVGLVSGSATHVPRINLQEAFTQYSCVRQSMLRYGRFLDQILMQAIACAKNNRADRSIALWLLTAMDRLQHADIPITHETLSNLLGLRRATVTTALSKFAREGIVETERGVIRISDRARLEPLGGEYYRKWRGAFEELSVIIPVFMPPFP
ncbi:MAG: Crp/Fnr family transcriptional regulator [Alphaproteobacteria bacterium]|nr:Crp/Fnr family transcriptional regulator [Alphaproteobacteria bacterium]